MRAGVVVAVVATMGKAVAALRGDARWAEVLVLAGFGLGLAVLRVLLGLK